ncbi:Zinc finger chaperone ZPR1 [Cladobotryum mycophilum]|uniref:Zinc finger chaperone ZPR1 n=1 Tax=Cladobotryum mycophilum TaxID=491253 RepID=A0ABR0T0N1_9HYPO
MSVGNQKPAEAQAPENFFQSIGDKAQGLSDTNGAAGEEEELRAVEEIESLCMNCHENGITRLLLTSIPYFREVVIMSFSCDHCGFQNNEMQPAGTIQPKGVHYELRLTQMDDFSRQVIKSDSAVVKFIEIDIEVPAGRGQLSNVEGLLTNVVDDLEMDQKLRKEQHPELHEKIAEIIKRGKAMLAGEAFPFRMYVDDPAGNSFISPDLKDSVGKWEKHEFARTSEQNAELGLADTEPHAGATVTTRALTSDGDIIPDEVYDFPATCPGCMHPCVTHMKMVDIPHFKQVVIMSTVCEDCGYRSNDVKTGGEIPELGEKITLRVDNNEDLARDILKSETCGMECPELNLSVNPGTLGGRFTTVEGLLTQVRDDLHAQIFESHGNEGGDSQQVDQKTQWDDFFSGLDAAIRGDRPFTVSLTDPFASSYVQSLVDPPQPDPKITRESYKRTDDEEEELGLKDMVLEGYEKKEGEEKEEKEEEEVKVNGETAQ